LNLNFHDIFQHTSTAALLVIRQQPEQYQPEAVAAAEELLKERNITPEDQVEADALMKEKEIPVSPLALKLTQYRQQTGELLDPLLRPQANVPAQKWLNILLLLIALNYGWVLYRAIQTLRYWWEVDGETVDVFLLFTLLNLVYIPLLFYGLLKKRRWGWVLLYADHIFVCITQLYQLTVLLRYPDDYWVNSSQLLLLLLIRVAFVFFLGRDNIRALFSISGKLQLYTALVAAAVAILYLLALERL